MTKTDEALRADIRRLGNQLGEALVRQHGPELLELVEEVRSLGKSARRGGSATAARELNERLSGLGTGDVIPVVRAFTTYFYLANVAEQVHRVEELATDDRYLRQTVDRVVASGLDQKLLDEVLSRFEVRPVFTAHPTEAARRSILTKRGEITKLLSRRASTEDADRIELIVLRQDLDLLAADVDGRDGGQETAAVDLVEDVLVGQGDSQGRLLFAVYDGGYLALTANCTGGPLTDLFARFGLELVRIVAHGFSFSRCWSVAFGRYGPLETSKAAG